MSVICCVTELHTYDFLIKDFVIKERRYLCQTMYLGSKDGICAFLHLLAFFSPTVESMFYYFSHSLTNMLNAFASWPFYHICLENL